MNTPTKGQVRCIIFREGDTWYGVALEFNIVESGDSFDVVNFNLQEAIQGYVASQRKTKGSRVSPLNQKPDKEYENLWGKLAANKPIPSPIQVKYYGFTRV
jgi:predicted RNase H-like HicB family nuclease